jgi:hypothetical protein
MVDLGQFAFRIANNAINEMSKPQRHSRLPNDVVVAKKQRANKYETLDTIGLPCIAKYNQYGPQVHHT